MKISAQFIITHLLMARNAIETGEPWYQPQDYALAAQEDCDVAIKLLRQQGITSKTMALAIGAIQQAAKCARSDSEEAMIVSWCTVIADRLKGVLSA